MFLNNMDWHFNKHLLLSNNLKGFNEKEFYKK